MPWLTCQVEQTDLAGEFEGRSVYECAWAALCEWATLSDDGSPLLTIRHGDRVWRVRQENVQSWRPLVRDYMARQMLHEARLRDPEGKE